MTKSELISQVAGEAGVTGVDAEAVITAFFSAVTAAAKSGDKVAWPGFGTFQGKKRPARQGRNPATGETIQIAASNVMHFGSVHGAEGRVEQVAGLNKYRADQGWAEQNKAGLNKTRLG